MKLMSRLPAPHRVVIVDEVWMRAWVAYGFKELGQYLAKHAAFRDYCERHNHEGAA